MGALRGDVASSLLFALLSPSSFPSAQSGHHYTVVSIIFALRRVNTGERQADRRIIKTTPNKNHELLLIVQEQKAPRVSIEPDWQASARSDWLKLSMQLGKLLLIALYPFVEPQVWIQRAGSLPKNFFSMDYLISM
jgi:hypothetical protein